MPYPERVKKWSERPIVVVVVMILKGKEKRKRK
jgi:hypothetical protein